ncbi:MAG: hypothetical protein ABIX01_16980 [Chitinophagaceae bacterium]
MKQIKWLLLALPVLVVACTSSKVTSSWKDPSTSKELSTYQHVLVVGMQPNNRQLKEEMENYLSSYLAKEGINAKASYDEFGPKAFAKMTEDEVTDLVRKKGYDAVITIALLDKQKEQSYNPGSVNYNPIGTYYNRIGRYYTTIYDRIYTPGYYSTNTDYFWETNLYDATQEKIIYSAQSKSFDPGSITSMSKEYGKSIVKDLSSKGLITKS